MLLSNKAVSLQSYSEVYFSVDTRIRSRLYCSANQYDCRRFSDYVSAYPVKLWLRAKKDLFLAKTILDLAFARY